MTFLCLPQKDSVSDEAEVRLVPWLSTETNTAIQLHIIKEGWIDYLNGMVIFAIPREVRQGHLPMKPSSVDSAEWPGNPDWGFNEEGLC